MFRQRWQALLSSVELNGTVLQHWLGCYTLVDTAERNDLKWRDRP